jgi:hypothetical protein
MWESATILAALFEAYSDSWSLRASGLDFISQKRL